MIISKQDRQKRQYRREVRTSIYQILSHSCAIPKSPVLFWTILYHPEQSCAFLSNLVLSCTILTNPVLSCLINPVLSCAILSNPLLYCAILCYPEQSCAIQYYPILSQSPYQYNYVISYLYVQLTHNDTKKSNAIFSNVVTLMSIWQMEASAVLCLK